VIEESTELWALPLCMSGQHLHRVVCKGAGLGGYEGFVVLAGRGTAAPVVEVGVDAMRC
jgi:hypothetical protein